MDTDDTVLKILWLTTIKQLYLCNGSTALVDIVGVLNRLNFSNLTYTELVMELVMVGSTSVGELATLAGIVSKLMFYEREVMLHTLVQ